VKKKHQSMYQAAWRTVCLNLKLRWNRSRYLTVLTLIFLILPGILSALNVPVLEVFIRGVEQTAQGQGMKGLLVGALLLCGMRVGTAVVKSRILYLHETEYMRVRCDLSALLMRSFSRKEPICFENSEMLNDIEKSKRGVDCFTDFFLYGFGEMLYMAVYLAGITIYMGSRSPMLTGILFVSVLPMAVSAAYAQKQTQRHEDKSAPVRRAADYCEKAMTDCENFKETRLLGAFSYFDKKYRAHIRKEVGMQRKLLVDKIRVNMIANLLSLTGFAVMLVVMVSELIKENIAPAAFAAIFTSLLSVYQELSGFFLNTLGRAMTLLPPLRNMYAAMELPERGGQEADADGLGGVVVENIHFRYPNAEGEAVRGVSLDIKPRETIAIVGENGAGKTTLVRLLTGLYLPDSGRVLIGGQDTRAINMYSAMRHSSAVFQKHMKYKLTLQENVRVSDLERNDEIESVLEQAGLPVGSPCFPDGKHTMLSREFDGVDLSGGQWQRVAIARGLYRAHSMIVLDEPTAAIDPLEETRVYRQFAGLSKDKTAVIVTHRIGSAKIADRIVVMKDGVIDGIGTHEELMSCGGEYKRMVEAQAEWYAEES